MNTRYKKTALWKSEGWIYKESLLVPALIHPYLLLRKGGEIWENIDYMQLIIYTHPALKPMVGYLTFSHSSTIALFA